jgi:hypothetical protein
MLIEQRAHGIPFARAWRSSLARLTWPGDEKADRQWRIALDWARQYFRDAYDRPHDPPAALMKAIAEPDDQLVDAQAAAIRAELFLPA